MGFPGVAKYLAVIYSVMLLHKPRSTQKKMTFTSLTIYLLSIGAGRGGGAWLHWHWTLNLHMDFCELILCQTMRLMVNVCYYIIRAWFVHAHYMVCSGNCLASSAATYLHLQSFPTHVPNLFFLISNLCFVVLVAACKHCEEIREIKYLLGC